MGDYIKTIPDVRIFRNGPNVNGYSYSEETKKQIVEQINSKDFFGQVNPDDYEQRYSPLNKASHQITNARFENGNVIVDVQILDTDCGQSLKRILDQKMPVSFSAAGMGNVDFKGNIENYQLSSVSALLGYSNDGRQVIRLKSNSDLKEEIGLAIVDKMKEFYWNHWCLTPDHLKQFLTTLVGNTGFWKPLKKRAFKTLRKSKRC